MIAGKYRRKNNNWWLGELVITNNSISSSVGRVSGGTVCTVKHKRAGLKIQTPKCPHCGVSLGITRVGYHELIYLPEVLEIEKAKAFQRADEESSLGNAMAVVFWNDRYLVLPYQLAAESPYETIYASGKFLVNGG